MTPEDKITEAINVAYTYGQVDGSHHKAWVIDQMVRALLGDAYDEWIYAYKKTDDDGNLTDPEDEDEDEDIYDWDEGIAP